jgi:hypothetical protein
VIELDVVDDRDVRQVLQELRGLVEVRAVVLVAFDDEGLALADRDSSRRRAEVARDAADQHRRIAPGRRQQPPVSDVVVVLPCVPAMTIECASQSH